MKRGEREKEEERVGKKEQMWRGRIEVERRWNKREREINEKKWEGNRGGRKGGT